MRRPPPARFAAVLGVLFLLEFAVLAIAPVDRGTWWLENALVFLGAALLVSTHRRFPLSRVSYTCIFVFLSLHEIGCHYTYSLVPYDDLVERVFGTGLNAVLGWQRNNFDRIIHFSYGLLLVYPMREVFLRIVDVRGFWGYALPLDLVMSTSMMYELIEWGAAVTFGGELGTAYLGAQGDPWDAQWDMALASLGALIAMGLTLAVNRALQRDFNAEWADSFRVKHPAPEGEEALARMLQ